MKQKISSLLTYSDKYVKLYENRIIFDPWLVPETQKTIMFSNVKKVGESKMDLVTTKPHLSGSCDFVNWFTWGTAKSRKKMLVFLETSDKIFKRIWFAPEKHDIVVGHLKKYTAKPTKNSQN
ncbi:MAG: hypothetical protein ACR2LL_03200 [Nitrosopumilus sp.]